MHAGLLSSMQCEAEFESQGNPQSDSFWSDFALGENTELWLAGAPVPSGDTYAETALAAFDAYADGLEKDDALQQILAWELVERSEALSALELGRSKAMGRLFAGLKGAPEGVDTPALNVIALAALHYLALRRRSVGRFAGLTLDESGAARVRKTLREILTRFYAEES